MKTIVFYNLKGGVGKSATATAVAHMLASIHKKRVLLIDIDPQGNSSSMFSDLDYFALLSGETEQKLSVQDLLMDSKLDPKECIIHTKYEGLDVIPAYLSLAEIEELIKADKVVPQQFKLISQLEKINDEYDYCLIDCSPSLSILNINALVAADEVYIPMGVDAGSIMGARSVRNVVNTVKSYRPRLKIAGAFFTRYTANKEVTKQAERIYKNIMTDITLIPISIRNNKLVEESSWLQEPLLSLDGPKYSNVTIDYAFLTCYLMVTDKTECINEYEKYKTAEKDLNKLNRLKQNKRKKKNYPKDELQKLETTYKGKKLEDYTVYCFGGK